MHRNADFRQDGTNMVESKLNSEGDAKRPGGGLGMALRWLDRNTEPYLMVMFYVALASIISIEVARRYLFGEQTQWGSVVSIYCFIWLSWLGCAYHVKTRGHLRFGEFRRNLPRLLQAAFYIFDDILWLVLASVVVTSSWHLMQTQMLLQNVIEGTGWIPMAVATAAVPAGWVLIVVRAVQDMLVVVRQYKNNEAFELNVTVVD